MTSRSTNKRIYKTCDGHGTDVLLSYSIWELLIEIGIFCSLKSFDVDLALDVLAIALSYEVAFDIKARLRWYPYDFANGAATNAAEYTGLSRVGPFACPKVLVTFGTDWLRYCLRQDFVKATLRHYKARSQNLHDTPSQAKQQA